MSVFIYKLWQVAVARRWHIFFEAETLGFKETGAMNLCSSPVRLLQVVAKMLEMTDSFQDNHQSTNIELWVVILVAVCLLLSVVQVLGVMGVFGEFSHRHSAPPVPPS